MNRSIPRTALIASISLPNSISHLPDSEFGMEPHERKMPRDSW